MATQAELLLKRNPSVSGSLLPTIFNIFDQWNLDDKQQMKLLGLSNEKTLYNWKKYPEKLQLNRDLLERASYILGIFKSLGFLFPDSMLADSWLSTPNNNPVFNGTSPMDRALAGQITDLALVRNFLNAETEG